MREFAKVEDVHEGDVVIADGGFTCLIKGKKYKVHKDSDAPSGLYIICMEGRHYLIGQKDKYDKHYVGLYKQQDHLTPIKEKANG